jgi:hypothetical protein
VPFGAEQSKNMQPLPGNYPEAFATKGVRRPLHTFGAVVRVNPVERFNGHGEKLASIPGGDARLHEPTSRRVSQGVGRDTINPRTPARSFKARLDGADMLPAIVNDIAQIGSATTGAPQMWEKARRYAHNASALVGLPSVRQIEIYQPALKINLRPAKRQNRF